MGRISKELKELEKRKKEMERTPEYRLKKAKAKAKKKEPTYPHRDRDYYWLEVRPRCTAPAGWYTTSFAPIYAKGDVRYYLDTAMLKPQPARVHTGMHPYYYLYKGPRPNPEWGEVCP